MPTSVAIYARISQDREGDGLGVGRQLIDCRAEAGRRGWPIGEEYVDDDLSAYSGKVRPAYERMLTDLRDGRRDAVIVWHLDRLHRRPIELELFVQTCGSAGVNHVVTLHGDFNIGNGDGLLVARLLSAVAASESDSKSRRTRRKTLEVAQSGRPHMGGTRPFGFEQDRQTIRLSEATVIRAITDRVLAGESLPSICRWLIAHNVTTVTGATWRTPVIRQVLLNPRYRGMRVHQGEVIGKASWAPIIDADKGERLIALLTDPTRQTNRSARSYLLSGMCRCALCGAKLYSMRRLETRRYLCRSGHDFGGCGHLSITADPLERLVAEAVLYRLDTPALAELLHGATPPSDTDANEIQRRVDIEIEQLNELAKLYGARHITATEWMAARTPIEQRLGEARRYLRHNTANAELSNYVGNGSTLRSEWATLNLDRQRAIVRAVVSHVVIKSTKPSRWLDPNRVEPVWRL